MLDEITKSRIHTIMAKALEHCGEAMEDHDWDKAYKLMDVAKDADHICRKHWLMEHMHEQSEMMR